MGVLDHRAYHRKAAFWVAMVDVYLVVEFIRAH